MAKKKTTCRQFSGACVRRVKPKLDDSARNKHKFFSLEIRCKREKEEIMFVVGRAWCDNAFQAETGAPTHFRHFFFSFCFSSANRIIIICFMQRWEQKFSDLYSQCVCIEFFILFFEFIFCNYIYDGVFHVCELLTLQREPQFNWVAMAR